MMRVLQTLALPLGHVAIKRTKSPIKKRAGSETRTRDLLLGKEVFYQLNYTRKLFLFSLIASFLAVNIDYYTVFIDPVKQFLKIRF